MEWYVDTKWACGWIKTDATGLILDSAPIFRRLRGQNLFKMPYQRTELKESSHV